VTDVEAIAARLCQEFEGRQLTIGTSRTVHRCELAVWIGGVQVPAPGCHTGFALDPTRLHATDAPADCELCTGRRRTPPRAVQVPGQLAIDQKDQNHL
jgi:hypothetical protein